MSDGIGTFMAWNGALRTRYAPPHEAGEKMTPRLTQAKIARWSKRIDTAHTNIAGVLDEVMAQAANSKAKHYQDLCDLRTDLRRVQERIDLCMSETSRIRA